MIEKVKDYFDKNVHTAEALFRQLNNLAIDCSIFLEQGNVQKFANSLNRAHECLDKLGVSTPKINQIVEHLKKQGALGAKLTGAGGGGLVLGIFAKEPDFLFDQFAKNK